MFVDFDGSLAPIVDEPEGARPLPGAAAVLNDLAGRYARVAVISGRPVSFLARHLAGAGQTQLHGLYGMERMVGGVVTTSPAAQRWRPAVEAAADRAEAELPEGTYVERKGLTVTLHYRACPAEGGGVERLAGEIARQLGLVAHPGKMSVELRPPVQIDKGTVLKQLAVGLTTVMFAGDDTGDLPAFAVLAELRAEGRTTLAVSVDGSETPAEVTAAADLSVDGPPGLLALLEGLAAG